MNTQRLISLRYLSSVRLTIVLLILITFASIAGTIIPQNWTEEQYTTRYGERLARVLITLQLSNVYRSYWYMALLAAFCVNLCVCSARGFGPLVRSLTQSSSTAGRVELSDLTFYREICLSSGVDDVRSRVRQTLARRLYRLKHADADSGLYYFERGKMGRLGPLVTHASMVIIIIGAILVGLLGFKEHKRIPVGETVDVPHSDFQVRADDFKAEFYPNSRTPKEYTSTLTVIEDGVPQLTEEIEVNHPMKYKGVKFYQSNYGLANIVEVELSRKTPDGSGVEVLGKFRVNVGEPFEVPDSQLEIKAAVLVPDFVIDSSGRVGTRSREPGNPAVFLELYEGDELKDSSWSFLKFPEFHGSSDSDQSLKLLSIGYYTELQISRDPGLPVIWFGCLLMVVGMSLSFYIPYKRVWVKLVADDGGTVMEIGARSYKDKAGFEKELSRLEAISGQSGGGTV